jgi:hypothetical protein
MSTPMQHLSWHGQSPYQSGCALRRVRHLRATLAGPPSDQKPIPTTLLLLLPLCRLSWCVRRLRHSASNKPHHCGITNPTTLRDSKPNHLPYLYCIRILLAMGSSWWALLLAKLAASSKGPIQTHRGREDVVRSLFFAHSDSRVSNLNAGAGSRGRGTSPSGFRSLFGQA